jgi:hypothetical protein
MGNIASEQKHFNKKSVDKREKKLTIFDMLVGKKYTSAYELYQMPKDNANIYKYTLSEIFEYILQSLNIHFERTNDVFLINNLFFYRFTVNKSKEVVFCQINETNQLLDTMPSNMIFSEKFYMVFTKNKFNTVNFTNENIITKIVYCVCVANGIDFILNYNDTKGEFDLTLTFPIENPFQENEQLVLGPNTYKIVDHHKVAVYVDIIDVSSTQMMYVISPIEFLFSMRFMIPILPMHYRKIFLHMQTHYEEFTSLKTDTKHLEKHYPVFSKIL